MTDIQTTDALKEEEVVKEIPRFGDEWKPVEGTKTHPNDWSEDDQKYFGLADFGDKVLMDEDGVGGWAVDLVCCELKVDPKVTSAREFATMVRADALSGKMTVDQIFAKYCCN